MRRHPGRSAAAARGGLMPVAAASAPAPDRQSRPRCQRADGQAAVPALKRRRWFGRSLACWLAGTSRSELASRG